MSGTANSRSGAVTLVEIAGQRPTPRADALAYSLLSGADSTSVTYADLDARARAFGAAVRRSCPAGSRALLILPAGLEYVPALLGCLYAGNIAVPAYSSLRLGPARSPRAARGRC
jgi:acyl-CoA synthetase (AMP-forming)/AMP-acid ligase II